MSPTAVIAASQSIEGMEAVQTLLSEQIRDAVARFRAAADLIGVEDVFELERGTAVAELAHRVALRQVVRVAALFDEQLPKAPPMRSQIREAPTHLLDDDVYPVGGFAAISNRGSLESLLHSQLAYMESGQARRPDLFDIKYLRDELLYYSRDENQFYRRRRHYVFEFAADLIATRIKDVDAPYQRIILTLAAVIVVIRRLSDWLNDEALNFELRFPSGGELDAERELLATIFQDLIANGIVTIPTPTKQRKKSDRTIKRSHDIRTVLISTKEAAPQGSLHLRPSKIPELAVEDLSPDLAASVPENDITTAWINVTIALLRQLIN